VKDNDAVAQSLGIVAEIDWLYTIHKTNFVSRSGFRHKHVIQIPVAMSAVSFDIVLPLMTAESRRVEAGEDMAYFEALARQVQDNPARFNSIALAHTPRFIL
jgi:hypothetical protein